MKKQLKKAIQESFDFPEAAHKDEFLREHGIPAEEERRHFIPIPLRITAAAAACAFAIVLWNFAKDPAVKIKEPEGNNIITTDDGGADEIHTSANDTIITTTADSEYITITTTAIPEATEPYQSQTNTKDTVITSPAVVTTAMNNINSKSTRTTFEASHSPETKTTNVSAAETTAAVNTEPVVVTTISEVDRQVADYERSIAMKKFLASAAAAASLINMVPTGVQATYNPPEFDQVLLDYVFPHIESGEASPDVNNDGKFDRYDLCDFWAYFMKKDDMITPEEREVIAARGDIDLDLKIKLNDFVILEQYYFYKFGIIPDDFDMYNYPDKNGDITLSSYKFVEDLKQTALKQDLLYQYTANLIETENIDLDFNGNGTADIYDILEYQMYIYSKFTEPFDNDAAKALVPLSSSTWENCDSFHSKCFFDANSEETLIRYHLYNKGFDPSYIYTPGLFEYTDELIAATPEGTNRNEMRGNMGTPIGAFISEVSSAAIDADMLAVADRTYKLDRMHEENYDEVLNAACEKFDELMLNGKVAPPDVDLDGAITMNDYITVMDYSSDLVANRDASGSVIPAEVWEHIDTELDLDGNGVSGDMVDLQVVEFVVRKYVGNDEIDVDINALLKAYNETHSAPAAESTESAEIKQIKYMEALSGKTIKRSGDADGDNETKMNDAVLVMQSISNPDRFELDDWGSFNADVNNTGDGITPNDALGIQKQLLGINE